MFIIEIKVDAKEHEKVCEHEKKEKEKRKVNEAFNRG